MKDQIRELEAEIGRKQQEKAKYEQERKVLSDEQEKLKAIEGQRRAKEKILQSKKEALDDLEKEVLFLFYLLFHQSIKWWQEDPAAREEELRKAVEKVTLERFKLSSQMEAVLQNLSANTIAQNATFLSRVQVFSPFSSWFPGI